MTNIEAKYLVYKQEDIIYAKNGENGNIDLQGTDAKTVLQYALGHLTPGRVWKEKVAVLGDFSINNSKSPLKIPDQTLFTLFGRMTVQDNKKILVSLGNDVIIENGLYDGNRGSEHSTGADSARVILADNKSNVTIRDLKVVNGFGRGIQARYPKNNVIENVVVENCDKNIMHTVIAKDLIIDEGVCFIKNVTSLNAVEFGLDCTSPNLFIDGYYSRGCKLPISVEGFNNIVLENINIDGSMHVSTSDIRGSTLGKVGYRVILNKIFAKDLYMRFKTPLENVTLDNVNLTGSANNGLQILASSDGNTAYDVKYVKMNNVQISRATFKGISISKDPSVNPTGRFKTVMMNNSIVEDCGGRGFVLSDIDHIQMNNSLAQGNKSRGIYIANCNRVKISNTNSLAQGINVQDIPLEIVDTHYVKAVNCFFEIGGSLTILANVTDYDFVNCEGSFPILRKSGMATIKTGQNSVTFTHGMDGTPIVVLGATNVQVTDAIWSSTNKNITISVSVNVTADRNIAWYAEVIRQVN